MPTIGPSLAIGRPTIYARSNTSLCNQRFAAKGYSVQADTLRCRPIVSINVWATISTVDVVAVRFRLCLSSDLIR